MSATSITAAEPPELMTTDEAAKLLRVSRTTIRRMLRAGELRSVKVRSAMRVRRADVLALLAGPAA